MLKTGEVRSCTQMVVLPGLQVLDPRKHVQVASRVLLNDIHDIIGPQAFLEPPL